MPSNENADSASIDVVITWVDGADPAHQARMAEHLGTAHESHNDAKRSTRFTSSGEIYFAVASVLKYLPFVRYIWIVTDRQRPAGIDSFAKAGLCSDDKIRIVDHSEILGDIPNALPTFNSRTIEAALWRIPGLSERYIYMNDDFMVLQPLTEDYFFDNSVPILRGTRIRPDRKRPSIILRKFLRRITFRPPNSRPSYRIAQERAAALAGETGNYMLHGHWPHPQIRSIQAAFHAANPALLPKQAEHRFRAVEQYNAVALTNHLSAESPLLPPPEVAYIKPGKRAQLTKATDDFLGDSLFGCIQSLDEIEPSQRDRLIQVMIDKLGSHLPDDLPIGPRDDRENLEDGRT